MTHDIDTSFNLSIEPYFGYIQQNGGKLWLDIKNLDLQNVSAMLTHLADLTSRYDIDKERLIIESRNWQALQRFTEERYYTSLYIGWENPSRLEFEEIDSYMDKLRKAVDHKIVHALSFPGWWYSTIKENLNRSIDLLTWKHRTTQWQLLLTPKGHKMLDSPGTECYFSERIMEHIIVNDYSLPDRLLYCSVHKKIVFLLERAWEEYAEKGK